MSIKEKQRYQCPCCGFRTLEWRGWQQGVWIMCPVCSWEDIYPELEFGKPAPETSEDPYFISLPQARKNFLAFGAADQYHKLRVRFPHPEEVPDGFPAEQALLATPEHQIALLLAEAEAGLINARNPALAWFDYRQMPALRWITGEAVPPLAVRYLFYCQFQSRNKEDIIERAQELVRLMDRALSGDFALALFNGWIAQGAPAKESWLLTLACALGEERLVFPLRQKIDEWANGSRVALAAQAVRTLVLINSDVALAEVHAIAGNYKKNGVRKAAGNAFAGTAERLGISQEELSDRVVPRLGFNEQGERVFDYGPRQFTVRLALDQTLRDSAGKPCSALPKPGAQDDAAKVAAAQATWKLLKKQLIHTVKMQVQRLEQAMIAQRSWGAARWQEMFLRHPLLRTFASSLVWGVVAPGQAGYEMIFRPLEDGSLTNTQDETITLPPEGQVRLVHPIELSDEQRAAWVQHLADYEVVQPFPQLNRPILRPTSEECEQAAWEKYQGFVINGLTMKGRYQKAGWQHGSLEDHGDYSAIWKAFPRADIEAYLQITTMWIGTPGWDDVALVRLLFLKDERISHGIPFSYLQKDDPRILKLGDVPPLVFSEAAGDVQTFAVSGLYQENWKEKLRYRDN